MAAGIAIVAFFVLFLTGLFGYFEWWIAASAIFVVTFGVVWVYSIIRDRDAAIDMIDE